MASTVMKSKLVFLLVIVLLVWPPSYANDDIPQASEVHRKLLGIVDTIAKHIIKHIPKPQGISTAKLPQVTPATTPRVLPRDSTPATWFGANGVKGFKVGWKLGKRYNSVAGKCEEHKDLLQFCNGMITPNPLGCDSKLLPQCVPYCVLEVANGINTCYENNGEPKETNTRCTFNNGFYYLGNQPISNEAAQIYCTTWRSFENEAPAPSPATSFSSSP